MYVKQTPSISFTIKDLLDYIRCMLLFFVDYKTMSLLLEMLYSDSPWAYYPSITTVVIRPSVDPLHFFIQPTHSLDRRFYQGDNSY